MIKSTKTKTNRSKSTRKLATKAKEEVFEMDWTPAKYPKLDNPKSRDHLEAMIMAEMDNILDDLIGYGTFTVTLELEDTPDDKMLKFKNQ